MRYAPYEAETIAWAAMTEGQLLDYFLTRVYETEEVWGLDDGCEWIIVEQDSQRVMPVWPYQQLVVEGRPRFGDALTPAAESLEDFVYQTLAVLMEEDAMLEVMPAADRPGCLVSPQRLHDIFTGMFEAGEYKLDT